MLRKAVNMCWLFLPRLYDHGTPSASFFQKANLAKSILCSMDHCDFLFAFLKGSPFLLQVTIEKEFICNPTRVKAREKGAFLLRKNIYQGPLCLVRMYHKDAPVFLAVLALRRDVICNIASSLCVLTPEMSCAN